MKRGAGSTSVRKSSTGGGWGGALRTRGVKPSPSVEAKRPDGQRKSVLTRTTKPWWPLPTMARWPRCWRSSGLSGSPTPSRRRRSPTPPSSGRW
eukprot:7090642-Prymnesium_polylepis.1